MSHAFPQRNVQHVPFALEVTSQHYTAKFTVSLLDEADYSPFKTGTAVCRILSISVYGRKSFASDFHQATLIQIKAGVPQ